MRARHTGRPSGEMLTRLVSACGLLLIWQIGATLADSRLLPSFTTVLAALERETASGALPSNLAITMARVTAAFILSLTIGCALGIAMGRWRRLDLVLDTLVTTMMNLPALVLIILIYVWFGLNEVSAIAAVALNKLPSTVITLREGARTLDPRLDEMAMSFAMPRWRALRHVILPQLAPYVFTAARSGLALTWKIVLVVELLGRSNGVGFQIQVYFQLFDVTLILAYTLALLAVVQAIEWAVLQPLERWATRWRG